MFGSDCEIIIEISSAFRVGTRNGSITKPRDVIVKLPNWKRK